MIFDALVAGYIRQNALRACVTIVAIALGVAALLAGDLARASAGAALRESVAGLSQRANLQVFGFGTRLDERLLARVRSVRGVEEARPVLRGAATLEASATARRSDIVTIEGIDALQTFPGSPALRTYEAGPFAPPSGLDTTLVAERGAIISQSIAHDFGLHAGSGFIVHAAGSPATLRVAAVLPHQLAGLDSRTLFVDVTTAQALFAAADRLDRIDVIVAPSVVDTMRARLTAALGPRVQVAVTANRLAALELAARGFEFDLRVLAAVVLLVGGALVANALGISVRQRRPEIGTLRALGATHGQILRAFLAEAVLLGACGALAGTIVGDMLARSSGAAPSGDALLIVLRDASLGIVLATAAALGPAFEAAATLPANAIRSVPLRPTRGASTVLGFAHHLPPSVRLALTNLDAAAARLGAALLALIVAVAASTCVATASSSLKAAVAAWAQRNIIGDLSVQPLAVADARFSASVRARIARLPTVAAVLTARHIELPFAGTFIGLEALDAHTLAARGLSLGSGEASVSTNGARRFGIQLGERIAVKTPAGAATLRIRHVDEDMQSDGNGTLSIPEATYQQYFGDTTVDTLGIVARRGTALGPLRVRLAAAAAPLAVDITSVREERALAAASFDRTFASTYALGLVSIATAILGTIVTMLALVLERRREIGILRMLGLSTDALRAMVVCEAALVAAFGAVCGAVCGIALGAILIAIDRRRFAWSVPLHVPAEAIVLTVVFVVFVAALAALVPARHAARLGTAGALRAE